MPRLPPSLASLAGDRGRPWHGTGAGSSEWAFGLLRASLSSKTESHPFWPLSWPLFHEHPKARPRYQRDTKAWCSKLELSVKPGNRSKEGMLVENEVQKVLEGRWSSHSKVPRRKGLCSHSR